MESAIPITLPEGWFAEQERYGVVITGEDARRIAGYVTVSETHRAFCLGMAVPRPTADKRYAGRGWRTQLYRDAVAALQEALSGR